MALKTKAWTFITKQKSLIKTLFFQESADVLQNVGGIDVVFGGTKEIAWYTRVEIIDFSSQLVVSGSQRITLKKKNPARIWVWSAIKIPQESFRTIPHCAFSSNLFHRHWADNSNLHRPFPEFSRRDKLLTTKFLQTAHLFITRGTQDRCIFEWFARETNLKKNPSVYSSD